MKQVSRAGREAARQIRPRMGTWVVLVLAIAAAAVAGIIRPALAEDRSGGPAAYMPVGTVQTAEIGNIGAVRNNPTKPVIIKSPEPLLIRSIQTYHWNNARGRRPGTIALRDSAGNTYGPWQAIGKPGQGGVRNAYWYVEPGVILPAGSYVLVDSDPKTWATNEAAGNKGFVRIEFQKVQVVAVAPEPTAPEPIAPGTFDEGSGPDDQVEEPPPQAPTAVSPPEAEPPAQDAWRSPETRTLFDGTDSALFVHHSAGGGVFDRDARFENGALVVDVPKDAAWGKVGILSPEPLVWLDDFTGDAQVTVTYHIDPARSTGFVLALAQPGWGGVGGNDPGTPNAAFVWRLMPDGKSRAELHLNPHGEGDFWSLDGDQAAPATVSFILRPGEVTVAAEGYDPVTKPWPAAADGTGFRVWAYSHVAAVNQPVTFALTNISVEHSYSVEPAPAGTAPGVKPLPTETLFDGAMNPLWEPAQIAGGDFAQFARIGDGALIVDVPKGHSWAKTGFLSTAPVVVLDHRVTIAPTRLTLTLDATQRQNLVVALSGDKAAEMWPSHVVWFTFSYQADKDRWVMAVQHSGYEDWGRYVDSAWMKAHWDGRIWLDIGNDWAAMRIPGGPVVRGYAPSGENGAYYATVIAHAPAENEAASLALKRIERGIATPTGMTAADRWTLTDDGAFNPDDFLGEIANMTQ